LTRPPRRASRPVRGSKGGVWTQRPTARPDAAGEARRDGPDWGGPARPADEPAVRAREGSHDHGTLLGHETPTADPERRQRQGQPPATIPSSARVTAVDHEHCTRLRGFGVRSPGGPLPAEIARSAAPAASYTRGLSSRSAPPPCGPPYGRCSLRPPLPAALPIDLHGSNGLRGTSQEALRAP
jgi:hypothetical protein